MSTLTRQAAVRQLREAAGFSQEKLAREIGASLRTIHRFETTTAASGPWLIRFAEMAREHKRPDLMEFFCREFGEDNGLHRCSGIVITDNPHGFAILGIQSDADARIAAVVMRLLKYTDRKTLATRLERLVRELMPVLTLCAMVPG